MEAMPPVEWTSVEAYLALEQQIDIRHEYIGGAVYAMAGASDEHIALCMNIAFALRSHLQGTPCRVQMSEGKLRLRIANEEIFYYPDVLVACDPRDTDRYFKRYPKVLVEVLSESTEALDRREKFLSYRQIETLEGIRPCGARQNGSYRFSSLRPLAARAIEGTRAKCWAFVAKVYGFVEIDLRRCAGLRRPSRRGSGSNVWHFPKTKSPRPALRSSRD